MLSPRSTLPFILEDLAQSSLSVSQDYVPQELCLQLLEDLEQLAAAGQLQAAGLGRGVAKQIHPEIRGDSTFWFAEQERTSPRRDFLKFLQQLQKDLNQNFFLGLKSVEAHYALYPPGAGYAKHLDQSVGSQARKITFILYLNPNWQESEGGELLIYSPHQPSQLQQTIAPRFGTLVLFRSELFPHQVANCLRPRKSLTGWFRG